MPTPAIISSSLFKAANPLLELGSDAVRTVSPSMETGEAFGRVLHGLTTGEPVVAAVLAGRGDEPVKAAVAEVGVSASVSGETVPSKTVPTKAEPSEAGPEHDMSHSIMHQSLLTPPGTYAIKESESPQIVSAPRADRVSVEVQGVERARASFELAVANTSVVASSMSSAAGLPASHPAVVAPGATADGVSTNGYKAVSVITSSSVDVPNAAREKTAPGVEGISVLMVAAETVLHTEAPKLSAASPPAEGVPMAKGTQVSPSVPGAPSTLGAQGAPARPRVATTDTATFESSGVSPLSEISLVTVAAGEVRPTDVRNSSAASAPAEGVPMAKGTQVSPSVPVAPSTPGAQGAPAPPRAAIADTTTFEPSRVSPLSEISLVTVAAGEVRSTDVRNSSAASAPAVVDARNVAAVKTAPRVKGVEVTPVSPSIPVAQSARGAQGVPATSSAAITESVSVESSRARSLPDALKTVVLNNVPPAEGVPAALRGTTPGPVSLQPRKSSLAFTPGVASAPVAVTGPVAGVAQAKPVQVGQEPPSSKGPQEQSRDPIRGPVTIPKAIGAVVESVQQPSSRPVLGAPSPQPAQPAQTQAQARAQVQAQVQAQPQPLPGHSSPAVQLREPAAFEAMRYEALRRNPGTKEQLGRPPTPDFTPMTAISVTPTASAAVAGTPPPSTLAPVVQVPSSADISLFSEGWENKLAELVDRMGSTGHSAGDSLTVVRLSPEHLGDLEIGVTMKDGEVDVSFAASVAETRVALEQALPKLRELLGQSGLELSNAGVYSSLPSGSERRQGSLTDAVPIPARADDPAQSEDQPPPDGAHPDRDDRGGVDLYV